MDTEKIEKKERVNWFKVSRRVSLPKNKDNVDEDFIPKEIAFEDNEKVVEQVAIAISKSMSVLLVGETGTGKTSLVRHLAFQTNNAFVRVNHNGGTTVEDIIGRWIIDKTGQTVWIDGILIQAMKKGYWFLADEINAASAEINFVYHSLLDDDGRVLMAEKGNEVVIPHKNFRFFGAMNPPTEYAGTKELNKALMSRFLVVSVDFPQPKIEEKILVDRTGIPEESAQKMVAFAAQVRGMHSKGDINFVFSTRDLIMWGTMFKVYKKYILAAETSVLNKINSEDYTAIYDLVGITFKNLDQGKKVESENAEEEEKIVDGSVGF